MPIQIEATGLTMAHMLDKGPKAKVYFGIWWQSDWDPAEITSRLGIEPTLAKPRGDPIPKMSSWKLDAPQIERGVPDVEAMSTWLADHLRPKADALIRIRDEFGASLGITVVPVLSARQEESTPMVRFTPAVVEFLASIGADINFDIYVADDAVSAVREFVAIPPAGDPCLTKVVIRNPVDLFDTHLSRLHIPIDRTGEYEMHGIDSWQSHNCAVSFARARLVALEEQGWKFALEPGGEILPADEIL